MRFKDGHNNYYMSIRKKTKMKIRIRIKEVESFEVFCLILKYGSMMLQQVEVEVVRLNQ